MTGGQGFAKLQEYVIDVLCYLSESLTKIKWLPAKSSRQSCCVIHKDADWFKYGDV